MGLPTLPPFRSRWFGCLAAASLTVTAASSHAQTVSTWTGGTGIWGNGALWSNVIPNGTAADAYIDGGKAGTSSVVTLENSRSVGRVTVDSGDMLTVSDGIALNVYNGAFTGSGSIVNNGNIALDGSSGGFPTIQFYGVGTISGTGTITLGGTNARIITATAGDRITIGAGQTIGGQGNLGGQVTTFTNNGTVTANQNGATLSLRPGGGTGDFTNGTTGVARAENGGTLQLLGSSSGGTFVGGTFAALAGSTVQITGASVSNATLSSTGTGAINITSPSTLSNVTNNGTLSTDGITTNLTGTFGGTGTFNVGTTGGATTAVNLNGPVTLGGTMSLNNANVIVRAATVGDRFTIGAGAKVTGQGDLGNGTTTITNNGYIIVNTGTLNIRPGGGTGDFTNGVTTGTNFGYVTANDGTTVHLDGSNGTFTNTANGFFTVESDGAATAFNIDAGKLTNLSGTTLSGGHYNVIGQTTGVATMSFGGGNITTLSNGAVVNLVGANSVFTELNALSTNNGTLQLSSGRKFTTAGNLVSTGNLSISGAATVLKVNGNLTFTTVVSANTLPSSQLFMSSGGTINVTGAVAMDPASVFAAGGAITATNMTLAGTIQPYYGINSRRLSLLGTVTLQNTAHLGFALSLPGNASANLYVQGNFTLAGTIDISADSYFGAGRYDLIDYTGGTFTNNGVTFGTLPSGYNYALDYSTPGQVNLVVTNAVPEPAAWELLAAGCVSLIVLRRRQSKASV